MKHEGVVYLGQQAGGVKQEIGMLIRESSPPTLPPKAQRDKSFSDTWVKNHTSSRE